MDSNQQAIIKTLLYSSLFSFPLRKDELYRYLISNRFLSKSAFEKALRACSEQIVENDGYYSLREYVKTIKNRKEMTGTLINKFKEAEKIAELLSLIPTIYFIGLSGGLAAGSAKESDDIDFFIITKKDTLFITRLLSLTVVQLLGKRRRFKEKDPSGKICLNMWIDTTRLAFPISEQDIYVAREVTQLRPLITRGTIYNEFIASNTWVTTYLPHAFTPLFPIKKIRRFFRVGEYALLVLEPVARTCQKFVIDRHRTTEIVLNNYLAFHPKDYRIQVLHAFSQRLRQRAKIL